MEDDNTMMKEDNDDMEMSLLREVMARVNDRELYRFWYILTGIMRARLTEAEFRAALD
jgi:hypothetical protein